MEASNLITSFPLELVQAVFDNLPPTDLKSALLVCNLFKRAGEDKKYWSWVTLVVTGSNLSVMPRVLATGRLQAMKALHLTAVSEELLKAVDSHPGLSVLSVSDCDVSSVQPRLFGKIVSKMEVVVICVQLTEVQIQEIFNCVSNESKLKTLVIKYNDLTSVDPETLARVITALEGVGIFGFYSEMVSLTPLQCETIFKFASNGTKLEELLLNQIDLSSLDPETLGDVISSLVGVNLNNSNLTSQQCKEIFLQVSRDSKVKELHMSDNDLHLSTVPPDLMVAVMSKVEILELSYIEAGEIIDQRWKSTFEKLSSDSILKDLDISFHDLGEVDPKDLARIIPKLEKANLDNTDLRSSQIEAIFESITCESKIKKLLISDNDLSSVNPEVLASAIINLEEIDLSQDAYRFLVMGLSAEQCQAIFQQLSQNSKSLKKLNMKGNQLSSVDPEVLAGAISNLEEIDLSYVHRDEENDGDEEWGYKGLSAEQCEVIFQWLSQDSKKVKKLNMNGNKMELVDPETIARVSAKLELNM